jgi:hypothetical protein
MSGLAPMARNKKPNMRVFFNGPVDFDRVPFIRQSLKYFTCIEIESLPGVAGVIAFMKLPRGMRVTWAWKRWE